MSFITTLSTGAFNMLFGIVVLQLGRNEGFLGQILAIGLLATPLPYFRLLLLEFPYGSQRKKLYLGPRCSQLLSYRDIVNSC